jgi:V/A-type H+-transporting ATPase subunit I
MRVDVEKFLLVGSVRQQESFFQEAQKAGCLEFIGQPMHVGAELTYVIEQITQAVKILRHQPAQPQRPVPPEETIQELVHTTLELEQERLDCEERLRTLQVEAVRLAPLGDFSSQDVRWIETISGRRLRVFFVPSMSKRISDQAKQDLLYLTSAFDLDYYIGLLRDETIPTPFVEMEQVRPLHQIQEEMDEERQQHARLLKQLERIAFYLEAIMEEGISLMEQRDLKRAVASVSPLIDGQLFAAFAWLPKTQTARIHQLCRKHQLILRQVAIEEQDRVPTALENKGVNRIGQDLVQIYDTPSQSDSDPSAWVLWAFAVFFAMIINDAGYGLLFLLGGLFVRWRKGRMRGAARRTTKLVMLLGAFSMVWGFGVHSFFGVGLAPTSALVEVSPLQWLVEKKADYHLARKDEVYREWVHQYPQIAEAKTGKEMLLEAKQVRGTSVSYKMLETFNGNLLLEIALLVGAIHLTLGMLRHLRANWAGLGWILCIWGGFLYAPSMLKATSLFQFAVGIPATYCERYGLQTCLCGLGLACILALFQRKWAGLEEITKVVTVLSDLLSYLRLYALGLAGAIVASTANELGAQVGLFVGTIIILIGHGVNILLGVMSGVIHGLRLNFLEWYHTCFEGGGRPFRPLRLLSNPSE